MHDRELLELLSLLVNAPQSHHHTAKQRQEGNEYSLGQSFEGKQNE